MIEKYRTEMVKGWIVLLIAVILFVSFDMSSVLKMATGSMSMESKFWVDTVNRGVVILAFSAFYFPAILLAIRLMDRFDTRYNVEHVKQNPTANAIYAGVREGCLIIASALVFCKIITVCLL